MRGRERTSVFLLLGADGSQRSGALQTWDFRVLLRSQISGAPLHSFALHASGTTKMFFVLGKKKKKKKKKKKNRRAFSRCPPPSPLRPRGRSRPGRIIRRCRWSGPPPHASPEVFRDRLRAIHSPWPEG